MAIFAVFSGLTYIVKFRPDFISQLQGTVFAWDPTGFAVYGVFAFAGTILAIWIERGIKKNALDSLES